MKPILLSLLLAACAGGPPPAEAPAPAKPLTPTEQVAAACGNPYDVDELAFTFVVVREGNEAVRRSHRWHPRSSTVEVTLPDGTTHTVNTGSPPSADDPAHSAWSAFVNDSFWLLAPCKVTDPGVRATPGEHQLSLAFGDVGLTPGDQYTLELDAQSRVTGWSFTLESGRTGAFDWSAYEARGPLNLSLDRKARDGSLEIRFDDVSVR